MLKEEKKYSLKDGRVTRQTRVMAFSMSCSQLGVYNVRTQHYCIIIVSYTFEDRENRVRERTVTEDSARSPLPGGKRRLVDANRLTMS